MRTFAPLRDNAAGARALDHSPGFLTNIARLRLWRHSAVSSIRLTPYFVVSMWRTILQPWFAAPRSDASRAPGKFLAMLAAVGRNDATRPLLTAQRLSDQVAPHQRPSPKVRWWWRPVALALALPQVARASSRRRPSIRMMRLNTEQPQALELLAKYRHGATEELFVFVHHFKRDTIAGLAMEGLITRKRGREGQRRNDRDCSHRDHGSRARRSRRELRDPSRTAASCQQIDKNERVRTGENSDEQGSAQPENAAVLSKCWPLEKTASAKRC
jgi:hypothetical protein